ncbi:hypothetical protein CAEBREN_08557 [Caenorhabditis brenneri]|uniref:NTF2-like domain-containing protein n=1 Tax=Caenorhabditis brenneri TaxID=135651 RepID=G0P5K1_CAEBE|nr:hypothetical protein CAEBREN_08557 [Caenorhabditis brenneri]
MLPHETLIGHSFQSPDADIIVKKFIERMSESIKNKMTGHLFAEIFEFTVCNRTYDKFLAQYPDEGGLFLSVQSVENLESSIRFRAVTDGSEKTRMSADFILNKSSQQLKSIIFPVCSIPKNFFGASRFNVASDATNIITEMLIILKQTIAKHDSSALGQLLDDNFVFKGCRGIYNKAETLNKITQVSKEADFNFALKSANWNKEGQIEYTVTISGALHDDFDAQFVYCPYRQVLKSGSIPSCPAKRMFKEPCIDDLGLFC